MDRRYHISQNSILKSFMHVHHQSCGWKYCVLIKDAWKFMASLQQCAIALPECPLNDYLIVECSTLESAHKVKDCAMNVTKKALDASIWYDGRPILDVIESIG